MKIVVCLLVMFSVAACVGEPAPTTFVLINDGDADIYRNASRWLSLEADGHPASLTAPGCMARCGLATGPIACATAAEYPTTKRLQPGDEEEVEWDGVYFVVREGESCYRERRAAKSLEAVFCYGHEIESIDGAPLTPGEEDMIPGTMLSDETCEMVEFESGGVVELRAE